MNKKLMNWKTKGMNRDLSVTAFNPEFAFENRNLRLGTNDGNTLMSWVNERGTLSMPIVAGTWDKETGEQVSESRINGIPVGTAVINHVFVVFSHDEENGCDYIYGLKYKDESKTSMVCKMLFGKNSLSLGFHVDHPLETLVSYESESIQKVYWTDGINQPRVINIVGNIRQADASQFDFVPDLELGENIMVEKLLGASGMFAPGVIQYAFTYYRKYGQETNIFYTSPLLYISYRDRGASPEDMVENAFKITIENPDAKFDYLRIYSIQRTSVNGTPICKRVQDISLSDCPDRVSYVDTGMGGNSIDPTELLYKGGEIITAETLEQKDNTLFMGNLAITRNLIGGDLKEGIREKTSYQTYGQTRTISPLQVSAGTYGYYNQLTSKGAESRFTGMTVPCGGFKTGDWYRLGVQFQHKSGRWSDPVYIRDLQIQGNFSEGNGTVKLPVVKGALSEVKNEKSHPITALKAAGYKRIRAVVVFPAMYDRDTICQGVACPTLYTSAHQSEGDLAAQSSWFFRPYISNDSDYIESTAKAVTPKSKGNLRYTSRKVESDIPSTDSGSAYNPQYIRQVEVQGQYNPANQFAIQNSIMTLHSPDIEFDEQLKVMDFTNVEFRNVGTIAFVNTLSDIDIQTETPTISSLGSGFVHKTFSSDGAQGIVSGLFYDDTFVDDDIDDEGTFGTSDFLKASGKWLVYPWHGTGSLNNDINRPANGGIQSAKLKKKVISNLRYATTALSEFNPSTNSRGTKIASNLDPQLFYSTEDTIVKLGNNIYKGNIDTMLMPDDQDGTYFAFAGWNNGNMRGITTTPFNSTDWCKTFNNLTGTEAHFNGIRKWNGSMWKYWDPDGDHDGEMLGEKYLDLVIKKLPVRMKYKSTPHLVFSNNQSGAGYLTQENNKMAIVEVRRTRTDGDTTRYGGTSVDALRENIWLPCGEPVSLDDVTIYNEGREDETNTVYFYYDYGDTYFQRYDCLKTYPFTREDLNQIVEIGSFMLETRVNIDGRYDRNRGQVNNLNVSPENFNLYNPVYSQQDNFFQYRIQEDAFYENTIFPNQVTWSLTKYSGADVDLWTNVTLASVLEMDGNKGVVTSLQRMNDMLLCFQDSGLARILYNEQTQISTTSGVPIEIANSGKVQGKVYLNDTVGCSNKWTIVSGTTGLFFMDSNDKSIYRFNGQIDNISVKGGFNTWCKLYFPLNSLVWDPTFPEVEEKSAFRSFYDRQNQEILFVSRRLSLAFSEKLGVFTSFYDYYDSPFFNNLDDTGIWLRDGHLWKHNAGDYCKFFGVPRPFSTILIGNPEPQFSKIFTNAEFRASVDNDGIERDGVFTPYLPFDVLETWNEYQHGIAYLANQRGHRAMMHHTLDNEASLKRKFRIWRCDIPRDNADNLDTFDETFDETFHMLSRLHKHPMDRMHNPWLYLRFRKGADEDMQRTEVHDIMMTYFI